MSLEYLMGYRVNSVTVPLRGQKWNWALHLDGDVVVRHYGDALKPAESVEGSVLAAVMVEDDRVILNFFKGDPADTVGVVSGNAEDFQIEWPQNMKPGIIERGDPAADLPPDPSQERVAHGPTMLEDRE
jgi:hypothetical protein